PPLGAGMHDVHRQRLRLRTGRGMVLNRSVPSFLDRPCRQCGMLFICGDEKQTKTAVARNMMPSLMLAAAISAVSLPATAPSSMMAPSRSTVALGRTLRSTARARALELFVCSSGVLLGACLLPPPLRCVTNWCRSPGAQLRARRSEVRSAGRLKSTYASSPPPSACAMQGAIADGL